MRFEPSNGTTTQRKVHAEKNEVEEIKGRLPIWVHLLSGGPPDAHCVQLQPRLYLPSDFCLA